MLQAAGPLSSWAHFAAILRAPSQAGSTACPSLPPSLQKPVFYRCWETQECLQPPPHSVSQSAFWPSVIIDRPGTCFASTWPIAASSSKSILNCTTHEYSCLVVYLNIKFLQVKELKIRQWQAACVSATGYTASSSTPLPHLHLLHCSLHHCHSMRAHSCPSHLSRPNQHSQAAPPSSTSSLCSRQSSSSFTRGLSFLSRCGPFPSSWPALRLFAFKFVQAPSFADDSTVSPFAFPGIDCTSAPSPMPSWFQLPLLISHSPVTPSLWASFVHGTPLVAQDAWVSRLL